MKLEDIVTVKVGINVSRLKETGNQSLDTYSYEDLTNDLDGLFLDSKVSKLNNISKKDNHLSEIGDVIFSFVSSKSTIVSDKNKGKVINQNFAKLIIEHDQLDRSYLCYVLNESDSIKKQMAISMQGSTVRKLTPSTLKTFNIKLPSLKKQKAIGKAYLTLKKRQALAKKQAEEEEQYYLEILKRLDQ